MTHAYAGDPSSRDVLAASIALSKDGLTAIHQSVGGMIANTILGESPKRTRNRPHINESPGHRGVPTG